MRQLGTRRSHLEILGEILDLCREPHAKTRIMHKTNLSYRSLQQDLTQLQTYMLLERHHRKETYSTTEKGRKFLQKWTDLQQFLGEESPKLTLYSRKNKIQFICATNNTPFETT